MTRPTPRQVAEVTARHAEAVAGVVRLDAGTLRTKATYGAGGRTDGVTVRIDAQPISVTVHVVVHFGERIPELAAVVAGVVTAGLRSAFPHAGPWDVGIDVVDVVTAEAALPAGPDPPAGPDLPAGYRRDVGAAPRRDLQ